MAQKKEAEIIKFKVPDGVPNDPAVLASEKSLADQQSNNELPSPALSEEEPNEKNAGGRLQTARIAAGHSIESVSEAIKVKVAHLQSIEEMHADLLPSLPYTIGFVKTYATFLGLEADALAVQFRTETTGSAVSPALAGTDEPRTSVSMSDSIDPTSRLVSLFAILAIVVFGFWVVFQITGGGRSDQTVASAEPQMRVRLGEAITTAPVPRARTSAPVVADDGVPENQSTDSVDISSVDPAPPAGLPDVAVAPVEEAQPVVTGPEPVAEEQVPIVETPVQIVVEPTPEPVRRPAPRRAPTPAPTIIDAVLTRSIAPDYPNRCARGADDLEQVTVQFNISVEGRVDGARVVSSTNDCFEAEAVRTLSRWRFTPKTINDVAAVEVGKTATLNFRK